MPKICSTNSVVADEGDLLEKNKRLFFALNLHEVNVVIVSLFFWMRAGLNVYAVCYVRHAKVRALG